MAFMDLVFKMMFAAISVLALTGELDFDGFVILAVGGYLLGKHLDNIIAGAPVYT